MSKLSEQNAKTLKEASKLIDEGRYFELENDFGEMKVFDPDYCTYTKRYLRGLINFINNYDEVDVRIVFKS